jgi:hypothetical protein
VLISRCESAFIPLLIGSRLTTPPPSPLDSLRGNQTATLRDSQDLHTCTERVEFDVSSQLRLLYGDSMSLPKHIECKASFNNLILCLLLVDLPAVSCLKDRNVSHNICIIIENYNLNSRDKRRLSVLVWKGVHTGQSLWTNSGTTLTHLHLSTFSNYLKPR